MIITDDGTVKQPWASYYWENGYVKIKLACGHNASNTRYKHPPNKEGKLYTCLTCTNTRGINWESQPSVTAVLERGNREK